MSTRLSQDPESSDAVVVRVRKLLDKAQATDNVHEAEAFARKAAELVARHRIDPANLAAAASAGADSDDLGIGEVVVGRGAYVRARLALLVAIAESHDVRVVFQTTPVGTVAFAAGHRSDLAVVEAMYASLHQQAAGQMARITRGSGSATQRFRRSFLFGFADRIGEIMRDARRDVEATVSADARAGTGLALRARVDRVEDFVTDSWGSIRNASRPSAVGVDGWRRGVEAADRVDVGRARLDGRRAIGRAPG